MATTKKRAAKASSANGSPKNRITEALPPAQEVTIPEPNFQVVKLRIRSTAMLVQNKFSAKARDQMMETQKAGSTGKKGKKREPKDFDRCFRDAQHISEEGWHGIPCAAFRNAMIDACRLVGFHMTKAKQAVFVLPDGVDRDEGVGLVKIISDPPEPKIIHVRNESGVADLRCLPTWKSWEAVVSIRFDADLFTASDVVNLLMRAGIQCGVQEGRPNSSKKYGMGWGTWELVEGDQK